MYTLKKAWAYFGTWHFGTKISSRFSAQRHFGTRTFWHHGRYSTGTFRHINMTAHVHFGTALSNIDISIQIFWHGRPYAETSMCRNILVPKCPSAVTSLCRNVHGAQLYSCQNVVVLKSPSDEKCLRWNVHAEMSVAEMSGAEISLRLKRC